VSSNNQLKKKLQPKLTKYIIHEPEPKQAAFLLIDDLDAFYGGAAGGGKVLKNNGLALTPFGFKKGVDLKIGQAINNPDGSISKIIQIHPEYEYDEWIVKFHDGTQTIVTGGHLWLAWRSGKRKKYKGKSIFGVNAAEVIETKTLKEWLVYAQDQENRGIRPNWPCIPVCEEQIFNITYRYKSKLNPYLLGVLLGDGCITKSGINITSGDIDYMNTVLKDYDYSFDNKYHFNFKGKSRLFLKEELIRLDLFGKKSKTKFIPREFLYNSIENRYSILSGLMDTDGTVDDRGHLSYTTISKQLANDVAFLIRSLGGVVTITNKIPFYRDKNGDKIYCNKAYTLYIKHRKAEKLFKLPRKIERAKLRKDTTPMYKRVVDIELTEKKFKGRCITVSHPNGLYITDDFIVTHNSDALLMAALQYVDIPGYNALLIRDTYKNLNDPEALMTRADEWLHGTDAHWSGEKHRWTFPSGATLSFGYLDGPRDHLNYKSAAYQFVGIDEVVSIREHQALFLFSRMRKLTSLGNIPIRFRCASNPPHREEVERGDWVKKRYVDEKTREGRIFIPAWMDDNSHINKNEYRKALGQLDEVTRRQLEEGDWDIDAAGFMFNREDFDIVKSVPNDVVRVRYWDRAATERKKTVTEENQPAATAGCKMAISKDKNIYIEDVVRFQKNPLANEKIIRQTAILDGIACKIYMEQEPGSSGVDTIATYRRLLMGFTFRGDRPSGSKITRAEPLSAQVEAGNVFLVDGKWIPLFLREAMVFPSGKYKDQIDSATGAFNKLSFENNGIRVRRI